jgi:hypothetical protein
MLSSLHPYRYWEEDGQYFFNTPSGAQYVAYFLELPFAKNLYTFNFDKLHLGTHGVVDVYVCDTICTILALFFQKHQDSMLVACDSSDGREAARMRLFESWYRRLAPEELKKIDRSGQAEEYRLFLSLFVWDDNPDKERLITILDEYCRDLLEL